jgi:hyperpolarization activated cyclic nucleotide-gated potassium channel 2
VNYLTGMMVIDIVTVFPFWAFDQSRSNRFFRLLRIARLIKILRASKFLAIVRNVGRSSKTFYIVAFFRLNKGIMRLAFFVLVVLILSHFAACIWFWMARMNEFDH